MDLERYVMDQVLNKIVMKTEDGSKYVNSDELEKLELNLNEYNFVKRVMEKNNIFLCTAQNNKCVEKGNLNIKDTDISKIEDLNYSDEELVFTDFSALDVFLDNIFIPESCKMVKMHSNDGESYRTIQLTKLARLKLSEKEMVHAMEHLKESGIVVRGALQDMEEFDNYDYTRNYRYTTMPESLDWNEQKKLFEEYKFTKDPKIKEKLILSNMKLIPYVACKYHAYSGYPQEELESVGYETLVKLIDKFDLSKGFKFSTFAVRSIQSAMYREMGYNSSVPIHEFEGLKKAIKIVEKEQAMELDYNDSKMIDDVIELYETGRNLRKNYAAKRKKELRESVLRIKFPEKQFLEYDHNDEYITSGSNTENNAIKRVLKDEVAILLDTLTERERRVLSLRFGIDDGCVRTLDEVGKEFNTSKEGIRLIEINALRNLKHLGRSKKLIEFLGDIENSSVDVMYDRIDKRKKDDYGYDYDYDMEVFLLEGEDINDNRLVKKYK